MNKKKIKIRLAGLALAASCLVAPAAWADSLYEFYSTTSAETLKQETREMSNQLRSSFDQQVIAARQQDIDFAEYYSNLQKLIFYGAKLATYAEFERDLSFARDNEIFKGLPEESVGDRNGAVSGKREFAQTKYEKMKADVAEEIMTYEDMLQLSLDSCQSTMGNNFHDLAANVTYQGRVRSLVRGKEYLKYQENRERLASRWGDLALAIDQQFSYWLDQPLSPEAPILDPVIVGAI